MSPAAAPPLSSVEWPPAGLALGRTVFPERDPHGEKQLERWARSWWPGLAPARRNADGFTRAVSRHGALCAASADAAIRAAACQVAPRAFERNDAQAGAQAIALVCEAALRALGCRPHPPQCVAAWKLLGGRLIELDTGEGKTLVAALAACIAALAGVPTHVVTVNDYLAARDARTMAPLFAFFGLGVGLVHAGIEQPRRAAAYAQPVTYCTNTELVFDYLRDAVATRGARSGAQQALRRLHAASQAEPGPRLRGLHFAIIDEADSVLIDDARTPLLLAAAQDPGGGHRVYQTLLDLAASLRPGRDFHHADARGPIELTDAGRALVASFGHEAAHDAQAAPDTGDASAAASDIRALAWAREPLVTQALRALHGLRNGRDYVVRDGAVQIVDESTGRLLPDRRWEQGLHQLIEVKEGCATSGLNQTLARITSQAFFSRYLRLSGMSGTLREIDREARAMYGVGVERVESYRACRRIERPTLLCTDAAAKHVAIVDEVRACLTRGQPVLVGTRSVRASVAVSAVLGAASIAHRVLNAVQNEDEAVTIARAGERGAVTVATNMAGRGTDIVIDREVAAAGGLHVVLTEWHASARIDRQLFGRCARQGDPGTCRAIVALDDELVRRHAARAAAWLARRWKARAAPPAVVRWLRRQAQSRAGRAGARQRRSTLEQERQLLSQLAPFGDGP